MHTSIVLNNGITTGNGGTSLELAGTSFHNNAGSSALNPGTSGRFLVWSVSRNNDNRGNIVYDFKQYSATYGTSTPAQNTGNGFIYSNTPILNVGLTGQVSKPHDGSNTAKLNAANYLLTGAIDGDVVTLNYPATGIYADKNSGTNKNIIVSGINADVMNGLSIVYGYQVNTSANAYIGTIMPQAESHIPLNRPILVEASQQFISTAMRVPEKKPTFHPNEKKEVIKPSEISTPCPQGINISSEEGQHILISCGSSGK